MLLASFIVEALSIGLCHAVYMLNFERLTALDGYWPTSGVLEETRTGLVSCAQFCSRVSGCRSFFHREKKGLCECHATLFNASSIPGMTAKETAGYYENKGTIFACPPDDVSFRYAVFPDGTQFQYRFLVDDVSRNFTDAVTRCSAEGGRLIQLVALQKFDFVRTLMETCTRYQTMPFWVDGMKNTTTGHWETLTGARLEMTSDFWYTGRPNNYGGVEFCVYLDSTPPKQHMLDDRPCFEKPEVPTYAVCEK